MRNDDLPIVETRAYVERVPDLAKDTQITCTVVSDSQVSYNGEVFSPNAAALKAIRSLGFTWSAVSGSEYWVFEDETLVARRDRLGI